MGQHGEDGSAGKILEWISANLGALFQKLGNDIGASRRLGQIIEAVSAEANDQKSLDVVNEIYENDQVVLEDHTVLDRCLESIQKNLKWISMHDKDICQYLELLQD